MSSAPLHRKSHGRASLSLYLAVVSGAAAIAMAVWGLTVLGGN